MLATDTKEAFDAVLKIEDVRQQVRLLQEEEGNLLVIPEERLMLETQFALGRVLRAATALGLTRVADKARDLYGLYNATHSVRTAMEILTDLQFIRKDFIAEASSILFLSFSPTRAKFFVGNDPTAAPFGESVLEAFPSAALDMREASNCYALERWFACVFHLMRVLEFGLRALADRFGVLDERSTWCQLIDDIEPEIRKIDKQAGADWKTQRKDFSGAATQFMFFKDAWRNHIKHVRDVYDEGRTTSIWQHTDEFMRKLVAIGLREKV